MRKLKQEERYQKDLLGRTSPLESVSVWKSQAQHHFLALAYRSLISPVSVESVACVIPISTNIWGRVGGGVLIKMQ